jgi:glycosyltransferase involved in cell wall biosynthesis
MACLDRHPAGIGVRHTSEKLIIREWNRSFIQDAIESVLCQTYSNWELIFVDDGSSDASTKIALRYVQLYPDQMRYFEYEEHQNGGMSASRNLGIWRSQGEYVAFLDADDVYLSQKLEEETALLAAQPAASIV